MNTTITLLNASSGGIRTRPHTQAATPYNARLALSEALATYPHTIPDGVYSAKVIFEDGTERTFFLECKDNTMKELFSYY